MARQLITREALQKKLAEEARELLAASSILRTRLLETVLYYSVLYAASGRSQLEARPKGCVSWIGKLVYAKQPRSLSGRFQFDSGGKKGLLRHVSTLCTRIIPLLSTSIREGWALLCRALPRKVAPLERSTPSFRLNIGRASWQAGQDGHTNSAKEFDWATGPSSINQPTGLQKIETRDF